MNKQQKNRKLLVPILIMLCILLLSLMTVYYQVETLTVRFIRVKQVENHVEVLQGKAKDPWQYRVLSEYVAEGLIYLLRGNNYASPAVAGFIVLRFLQNAFIFSLAAIFYRKLGLSNYLMLLGLSILAWSMTHSLYDSDLSFNTYFDVAFYILAAILIMQKKYVWLIPLVFIAALNRETSGLIPFMLLTTFFLARPENLDLKKTLIIVGIALAVFVLVFIGLRWYYGPRPMFDVFGFRPGYGLFRYNTDRFVTWMQATLTLGLLPILAGIFYKRWPASLKAFFWAVVPLWLGIHFVAAVVAESRLLLVPQALVFIPGALLGLSSPPKPPENPTA